MNLLYGLVSEWKLDEASGSRADVVGGLTLTTVNAPLSATGKVYPLAADFVSASLQYLTRGDHASLRVGNFDFTFELWFYLNGTADQVFVGKDSNVTTRDYAIDYTTGFCRFYHQGGSFGAAAIAVPGSLTGAWHHLIAYYRSSGMVLGLRIDNGTPATVGASVAPSAGTAEFRIGSREFAGFEGYTNGRLGPVRRWNRALSVAEENYLWNGGAGRAYSQLASNGQSGAGLGLGLGLAL